MINVEEKVKEIIINKLCIEESDLTPTSTLIELGGDSLDGVELILDFESEFNISIPNEDADRLDTVQDYIDYFINKLNNAK